MTGWSGIGQSTDLICPYSMLRFVAAIANDGILVEPRLIDDGRPAEQSLLVNPDTARTMQDLMRNNVIQTYGDNRFPGLEVCGKTGTAEVGDGTDHAWFTGFLKDEDHPYAFIVFVGRTLRGHPDRKYRSAGRHAARNGYGVLIYDRHHRDLAGQIL